MLSQQRHLFLPEFLLFEESELQGRFWLARHHKICPIQAAAALKQTPRSFWVLEMKFRFFDEWIRHFEDTKWAK